MLAYLTIGIVLGPHGLQMIAETHTVETFAEFGVVFLMFSIGLEFNLQSLTRMRKAVFGYGTAQVVLTMLGTALITRYGYAQNWRAGVAVGLAVAMSSTAIVAKMLSDRFELHSRSGRQTMGVLLFQDLALVPCLLLFPALAQPDEDLWRPLAEAMLQAIAVLAVMIVAGKKLMGRLFDAVAHHKSDELFVLATLWIVVGLSYATGKAGLSLALGAFVGGALISETVYRHQVEADIRPFRDILLGLFFVTVGMLLDLGFVLNNPDRLLLAVALLVAGKGMVVLVVVMAGRTPLDVALRTAGQLAQAGEFGLVLIEFAHELKLIGDDVFQVTMAAMLISLFLAPGLIERAANFGKRMARGDLVHGTQTTQVVAAAADELNGHVLIIRIDRPKKLNGFTVKMIRELAAAYTLLERSDDARVGLLCAEGAHFNSGRGPNTQTKTELLDFHFRADSLELLLHLFSFCLLNISLKINRCSVNEVLSLLKTKC